MSVLYLNLRSLSVQKILFNEQINRLKVQNLHNTEEELFTEASKLVCLTATFDGLPITPAHSTGDVIDLELIDIKGNLINLGMEIKDWYKVDPDICKTPSKHLSGDAIKNRVMLLEIMLELGFVNYPNEWWHFSYGDRLWAALTNKNEAITS